jgi:hypothetical protein
VVLDCRATDRFHQPLGLRFEPGRAAVDPVDASLALGPEGQVLIEILELSKQDSCLD